MQLLERIAEQTSYWYFAEVPKDTLVWSERPTTYVPEYTGKGRPPTQERLVPTAPTSLSVAQLVAQLPASA